MEEYNMKEEQIFEDSDVDIKARRSSILKAHKGKSNDETEDFTMKSTRRVSFASSNFVKPFAADPEKNTIWDLTYEEEINHTDSTKSSVEKSDLFNTTSFGIPENLLDTPTVFKNKPRIPFMPLEVEEYSINKENIFIPPDVVENITKYSAREEICHMKSTEVSSKTTIQNKIFQLVDTVTSIENFNQSDMDLEYTNIVPNNNEIIETAQQSNLKQHIASCQNKKYSQSTMNKIIDSSHSVEMNDVLPVSSDIVEAINTVKGILKSKPSNQKVLPPTQLNSQNYLNKMSKITEPNKQGNNQLLQNKENLSILKLHHRNNKDIQKDFDLTSNKLTDETIMKQKTGKCSDKVKIKLVTDNALNVDTESEDNMELTSVLRSHIKIVRMNKEEINQCLNRTIHYQGNDSSMELTSAFPGEVIVQNEEETNECLKRTIHYQDNDGNMEFTSILPSKEILMKVEQETIIAPLSMELTSLSSSDKEVLQNNEKQTNECLKRTIHYQENDGNMELTSVSTSGEDVQNENEAKTCLKRRTIHYQENDGDMEFTSTLPGKEILMKSRQETNEALKTIRQNDDGSMELTSVSTSGEDVQNENEAKTCLKRRTIHYQENDGDMEFTSTLPGKEILTRFEQETNEALKTIHQNDDGSVELTSVSTSGEDLQNEKEANTCLKRRTIHYQENDGDMEFTSTLPGKEILTRLEQETNEALKTIHQNDDGSVELTSVSTSGEDVQNEKEANKCLKRTIHYQENDGDMEFTSTLPGKNILMRFEQETKEALRTIHEGSMELTSISQSGEESLRKGEKKTKECLNRRTIHFQDTDGSMEFTSVLPSGGEILRKDEEAINEYLQGTIQCPNANESIEFTSILQSDGGIVRGIEQETNECLEGTVHYEDIDGSIEMSNSQRSAEKIVGKTEKKTKGNLKTNILYKCNDGNMEFKSVLPSVKKIKQTNEKEKQEFLNRTISYGDEIREIPPVSSQHLSNQMKENTNVLDIKNKNMDKDRVVVNFEESHKKSEPLVKKFIHVKQIVENNGEVRDNTLSFQNKSAPFHSKEDIKNQRLEETCAIPLESNRFHHHKSDIEIVKEILEESLGNVKFSENPPKPSSLSLVGKIFKSPISQPELMNDKNNISSEKPPSSFARPHADNINNSEVKNKSKTEYKSFYEPMEVDSYSDMMHLCRLSSEQLLIEKPETEPINCLEEKNEVVKIIVQNENNSDTDVTQKHKTDSKIPGSFKSNVLYSTPGKIKMDLLSNSNSQQFAFTPIRSFVVNYGNCSPCTDDTQQLIHATISKKPESFKMDYFENIDTLDHNVPNVAAAATTVPENQDKSVENVNKRIASITINSSVDNTTEISGTVNRNSNFTIQNSTLKSHNTLDSLKFLSQSYVDEEKSSRQKEIDDMWKKFMENSRKIKEQCERVFSNVQTVRLRDLWKEAKEDIEKQRALREADRSKNNPILDVKVSKSIYERICEVADRCEKQWIFDKSKSKDDLYCFSVLNDTVHFQVDIHPELGIVNKVDTCENTSDGFRAITYYKARVFQYKMRKENLLSALGVNFEILTLLDYVSMTIEEISNFNKEFEELKDMYKKSHKFQMDHNFNVIFKILSTTYKMCWIISVKMSLLNIGCQESVSATHKIGEKVNEEEIQTLANNTLGGQKFLRNFIENVEKYKDRIGKRIKFKTGNPLFKVGQK